jgi:hypothetical protein
MFDNDMDMSRSFEGFSPPIYYAAQVHSSLTRPSVSEYVEMVNEGGIGQANWLFDFID